MKKHLLILMMALLPMVASSHDAEIDGIYYNLNEAEKTATVTFASIDNQSKPVYSGAIVIPRMVTFHDVNYSVTSIGDRAFSDCSNITSIEIAESIESIGKAAFEACTGLTSLTIPKNVTSISEEWWPFSGCSGLTSISVEEGNPVYDSREGCNAIIETETNTVILGCKNSFIPNSVTCIGSNAFAGCSDLTSIEIPNGVTSIGVAAFINCTSLTSIELPNSVTSIDNYSFSRCSNLGSIIMSDNVTYIGVSSFSDCSSLTSINIPNSVTEIGSQAFAGCSSLTFVIIPNSVVEIGESAFLRCSSLASVSIGNGIMTLPTFHANGYHVSRVFGKCPNITTVYWNFNYKSEFGNIFPDSNVENIILGADVTSIEDGAFNDYDCLKSITFHTPTVPNWFAGNTNINEVVLGEEVTKIEKDAFVGCTNLKSIILPDEITEISHSAFDTETLLLVKRGSKTLLSLWSAGYKEPKDINTSEVLVPTNIKFISSTQCTAKFHVDNIYSEYETTYDGTPLQGEDIEFTSLKPDCERNLILKVTSNDHSYETNLPYSTLSLNMRTTNALTATSFTSKGEYDEGDAKVIAERMEFDGNTLQGNEISAEGLDPSKEYEVTYVATVRYGESDEFEEDYKYVASIRTDDLVFNTLPPKVVSKGEVVVAAESNLANDELKVGFEWRRSDAPEELESKSGEAFLYNGTTEGILHNLTSFSYWRYRPYYESASGKRFYGAWGIVEADDDSYFEPTVHTYANIEVTDNTAQVNGYALNGTDEVLMQGFMYWRTYYGGGGIHNKAIAVPTDAMTVELDNKQQKMSATLTNLEYDSEYSCVAFVTTTDGKTFYGEEQKFITGEVPASIEIVEIENTTDVPAIEVARYNMNGQQIASPQKGVNIIRYSDGTTKKVYVK